MKNSNIVEYKGYYSRVEYSADDGVLFGVIEGIADLVTFECDSAVDVQSAFEEAVDDYLLICEEHGKEPEKAYKGTFNVRIDPELHRVCARRAYMQGVSLNQYVEESLKKSVENTAAIPETMTIYIKTDRVAMSKTACSNYNWTSSQIEAEEFEYGARSFSGPVIA